jgi:hypothetical protein
MEAQSDSPSPIQSESSDTRPQREFRNAGVAAGCPKCGYEFGKYFDDDKSLALDGKSHFICFNCNTPFRKSLTRGEQIAIVVAGILSIIVAATVYWSAGPILLAVPLSLFGAGITSFGVFRLLRPLVPASVVELISSDERAPEALVAERTNPAQAVATVVTTQPPRLKEWIDRQAAADRPLARFFQRGIGSFFAIVGGVMVFVAGAFFMRNFNQSPARPGASGDFDFGGMIVVSLLFVLIGGIGMWLSSVGRGLNSLAAPAWKALVRSNRPPVLLLRSFDDDRHRLWTGNAIERKLDPWRLSRTLEDTIADVFKDVAVTVTAGRPGEKLSPSGAARARLGSEEWRNWVQDFLAWSQRVIMVMGNANQHPALAWEIDNILAYCAPEKLILVPPPNDDEEEVKARWLGYKQRLQGRIPDYRPDVVMMRFTGSWNVLVTTIDGFRNLSPEDKHQAVVSVLSAYRDWKRPVSPLPGVKLSTEVITVAPGANVVAPTPDWSLKRRTHRRPGL